MTDASPRQADEPMTPSERLKVLAEHYRETFGHQREYIARRDRSFLYALLAGIALAYRVSNVPGSDRMIAVMLQRLAGQEIKLEPGALALLLWFLQFALVVRYFQATMTVERQYRYIARVEAEMNRWFGGEVLARESAAYLVDYPRFSDWVHFVYSWIFPSTLVAVVCWSVVSEFQARGFRSLVAWVSAALALATLATIGLFLHSVRQGSGGHQPEPVEVPGSSAPGSSA